MLCLLKAIQYGIQSQYDYTEEAKVLTVHVYGTLGMPKRCDLVTVPFCLQVAIFLWVLYFRNRNECTELMANIVDDNAETKVTIYSSPLTRGQREGVARILLGMQSYAVKVMNLLQVYTLIVGE